MDSFVTEKITNEWDYFLARVSAKKFADRLGFCDVNKSKIILSAAELSKNILVHAEKGEISFETITEPGKKGIKISAFDQGPGIENIDQALQDGFSTANSLGYGLPSVKRMMDEVTIDSEKGRGTKIVAVKWLKKS
ncbi:anti-sigma regulatory factor [Bacillus marinisedimentorum]|uniref:anti-sigma regulatory factor n=1 Tax=Bacillus marinisedimentorum TaxID=1821260 RepID=UPI000872632D|nr:anti-sigma regulatory factor [Bacillus marinisedimentorum]